jgi:hypothetical protein
MVGMLGVLVMVGLGRKVLMLIVRLHILVVFITSHATKIDFYFIMSSRSWLAGRRWPRTVKVPTTSCPAHVWWGPLMSHLLYKEQRPVQIFEGIEAPRLVFLLDIRRLSGGLVVVIAANIVCFLLGSDGDGWRCLQWGWDWDWLAVMVVVMAVVVSVNIWVTAFPAFW